MLIKRAILVIVPSSCNHTQKPMQMQCDNMPCLCSCCLLAETSLSNRNGLSCSYLLLGQVVASRQQDQSQGVLNAMCIYIRAYQAREPDSDARLCLEATDELLDKPCIVLAAW